MLLWLAWPPIPYTSVLLLVALVPLLLAAETVITGSDTRKGKKIFLLAGITFLLWNSASIYWVYNSLASAMPGYVAAMVSVIPYGLGAVLMTLAFWLYAQLRKVTTTWFSYLGLISFWIGYEYLHQEWDLCFPWMNLGNGFATTHQLVQWYEYTGVYGGTLWILVVNLLVFERIRVSKTADETTKRRLSLSLAAAAGIPVLWSLVIFGGYKERPDPANVVVVQPNIDPYNKFGDLPVAAQVETLTRLSDSVGQVNTEFFIWPETAIASYTNEEFIRTSPYFLTAQNFLQKYKNGSLLTGIESYALYDSAKTPSARYREDINKYLDAFNAAVLIENSAKVQFYHKSKLVPGVESLPFPNTLSFMKPLFEEFGGSTGGYGRQQEPSVLYAQSGIGAAPVICYESVWGDWVRKGVKKGAQFIAIVTNDGWWGNTSGKDQHFDYAKLRAIETRRWVARSANTGISGFINQRGDVVSRSKWWVATALKADINLNEDLTFYVKHGDFIALAGCFGCGVFGTMLLFCLFRRKKGV
nr:apolipoprotein N-acyltransferase [Hufsiella ginkgonis]